MCTRQFKIEPILELVRSFGITRKRPALEDLGIAHDEWTRANYTDYDVQYCIKMFPLVLDKIGRAGCEEIIRKQGWPSPGKSGCTGCFLGGRRQLIQLSRDDLPEFMRWVRMEEAGRRFPGMTHLPPTSAGKGPLRDMLTIGSLDGFMIEDVPDDSDEIGGCNEGHCYI